MSYANILAAARGLGETTEPFDLNEGANVVELKQALVALGRRGSDPTQTPDAITERIWKEIVVEGELAGGWEGPAADELVAAISRYAPSSGIDGPYYQLGGWPYGKYGIVGGPQPTAAGLEVIAGAVHQKLGGQPIMSRYLAWRDGSFDPPSSWSRPGDGAQVIPTRLPGRYWNPVGYTPYAPEGVPAWQGVADDLDDQLIACWTALTAATTEADRKQIIDGCIRGVRAMRHDAVKQANQTVPAPQCSEFERFDYGLARCVKLTGVVTLPTVTVTTESCIEEMIAQGHTLEVAQKECAGSGDTPASMAGVPTWLIAVGAGIAVGGGAWWLTNKRRQRR